MFKKTFSGFIASLVIGTCLLACGGGGSDSATPDAAPKITLGLANRELKLDTFFQESVSTMIEGSVSDSIPGEFFISVVSSNDKVAFQPLKISISGERNFSAIIEVSPSTPVGTHTGTLKIDICRDVHCTNSYLKGKYPLPFTVTVLPSNIRTPLQSFKQVESRYSTLSIPVSLNESNFSRRWSFNLFQVPGLELNGETQFEEQFDLLSSDGVAVSMSRIREGKEGYVGLSEDEGRLIWRHIVPKPRSPALDSAFRAMKNGELQLLTEQASDTEFGMTAFSLDKGEQLWNEAYSLGDRDTLNYRFKINDASTSNPYLSVRKKTASVISYNIPYAGTFHSTSKDGNSFYAVRGSRVFQYALEDGRLLLDFDAPKDLLGNPEYLSLGWVSLEILNDELFLMAVSERTAYSPVQLSLYDSKSRQVIWTRLLPAAISSSNLTWDYKINLFSDKVAVFGSNNCSFAEFDLSTGTEVSSFSTKYCPRSNYGKIIYTNNLVILDGDGVQAYNKHTGAKVWSYAFRDIAIPAKILGVSKNGLLFLAEGDYQSHKVVAINLQ